MLKPLLVTLAAAALLAGCAFPGSIPDEAPRPDVVAYHCADGVDMVVTYAGPGTGRDGSAVLHWDGKTFTLPQQVSGSGTRYGDGTLTLYTKGDDAFLEKGGEVVLRDCVVDTPAAASTSSAPPASQ